MAMHVVDHPTQSVTGFLGSLASGVGGVFAAIIKGMQKSREYQALNLLSDHELAQIGVTRDQLAHYVFADRKA